MVASEGMIAGGGAIGGPRAREAAVDALVLQGLSGVGPKRFRQLVDRFGSPGAALVGGQEFDVVAGKRAASARRALSPSRRGAARALARRCAGAGIELLVYGAPEYPARLGDLPDPPSILFTIGRAELLAGPCVAVVGSRAATVYGRRVARALGAALASRGKCVVSGMAVGIDSEAHWGALPGATAAVLGSGTDVASPPRNAELHRKIRESGVVASEFPPGVRAEPHHFPRRNRIIAALATDVIVVEASRKSGALITVDHALDLGREVHAVPGPIDRPTSEGANRLIADGAGMILEAGLGEEWAPAAAMPAGEPNLQAALAAVPVGRPVTVEEVAQATGLPAEDVAAAVAVLELRGFLVPTRDGRVVRTPGGRATA